MDAEEQSSPSFTNFSASGLGSALTDILMADDIQPGTPPSYELCKAIYLYHPLGGKMAEAPVALAQSQEREIVVQTGPKEVVDAWLKEWKNLEATRIIANEATQSRVYGLATVAMIIDGKATTDPIELKDLWKEKITFNVWDPLNTSGLIIDQDPNSPTFQKHGDIICGGKRYHRSRTLTMMNEESIYIAWTTSSYAYSGRSCYQRGLYPLKSFINSMRTDDLVLSKAGVFITKLKSPGSIVDNAMQWMGFRKRNIIKQAKVDNVISIGLDESVETLNMSNVQVYDMARNNNIKNIATSDNMPAKLLTQEAFVEGFGEGTQDAYAVAQYGERFRVKMAPIYDWFDTITMYRAWNEEFYETIREQYPEEYGSVDYLEAFYRWKNGFQAVWPSLIREPPSEEVNVDDVRLKALIAVVQVFVPLLDPDNMAKTIEWACDQLSQRESLFGGDGPLLDFDMLRDHMAEELERNRDNEEKSLEEAENSAPEKPFSGHDAASVANLAQVMRRARV